MGCKQWCAQGPIVEKCMLVPFWETKPNLSKSLCTPLAVHILCYQLWKKLKVFRCTKIHQSVHHCHGHHQVGKKWPKGNISSLIYINGLLQYSYYWTTKELQVFTGRVVVTETAHGWQDLWVWWWGPMWSFNGAQNLWQHPRSQPPRWNRPLS